MDRAGAAQRPTAHRAHDLVLPSMVPATVASTDVPHPGAAMSAPANTIAYLYDDAAIDVSRITGIPWAYQQLETGGNQRPCINLLELDWFDRMKVAFAVIAVENMLAAYFNRTQEVSHERDHVLGSPVADSSAA